MARTRWWVGGLLSPLAFYTLVFFVIIIPLLVALQWASKPRDPNAVS